MLLSVRKDVNLPLSYYTSRVSMWTNYAFISRGNRAVWTNMQTWRDPRFERAIILLPVITENKLGAVSVFGSSLGCSTDESAACPHFSAISWLRQDPVTLSFTPFLCYLFVPCVLHNCNMWMIDVASHCKFAALCAAILKLVTSSTQFCSTIFFVCVCLEAF